MCVCVCACVCVRVNTAVDLHDGLVYKTAITAAVSGTPAHMGLVSAYTGGVCAVARPIDRTIIHTKYGTLRTRAAEVQR